MNDKTTLASNESHHPKTPQPKPTAPVFMWISALSLLTTCGLGFATYHNWQLQTNAQRENTYLMQQLHELKKSQTTTHEQWQTELTEAQAQTQATLNAFNTQLQSAITPSTDVANHWLLLKARYAIELAQLNAYWSSDRQTTIALLKQADTLLAQHQNPQLFTVRQALAREITAQETTPTLDQAGILSQLDALQQQITTRPFNDAHALPEDHTRPPTSDMPESWQARMHASVGLLKQFFVVRYHPDPLQPLLTPAYKALQRETIRLSLQEAQWAVLQRNEAVYQLAIKQTIHQIKRAFGKDNTRTELLIKQLNKLATISVQDVRMTPEDSLITLNQILDASPTYTAPADERTSPEPKTPSPPENDSSTQEPTQPGVPTP